MTEEDFQSKWIKITGAVADYRSWIYRVENKMPEKFQPEKIEPSQDDKSYITPAYANNQYLAKQDIQEFTQQELEEAFK